MDCLESNCHIMNQIVIEKRFLYRQLVGTNSLIQVMVCLVLNTSHHLNQWIPAQYTHDDVIKWKHFARLLATCTGNSPVTGEFPAQRPMTRSFDVFFYLCLNIRLSKQSWGWWFETPSCPLWRHCNERHNASPSLSIWILPFRVYTVSIFREEISKNEAGMVIGAEAEETVFVQRFSLLLFVCKKVDVKIFISHGVCNGNWLRCNLCSQKSLKTNSMSPNALLL